VRVRRLDGSIVWQDSRAEAEVAWTADGTKLAALSSRYSGRSVRVWDSSGSAIGQYDYPERAWTVGWSPDGKTLTTGHERFVEVRNVSDNTVEWKAITPDEERPPIVIRNDGSFISGDAETLEEEIVFIVEEEDGRQTSYLPSEFAELIGEEGKKRLQWPVAAEN
jgi:hypothetical protein